MGLWKWFRHDIRRIAYVILTLDLLLFIAWFIIAIYPVSVTCPEDLLLHVVLLLHFAQAATIGGVLDTWSEEIEEHAPIKYAPYSWIIASIVALFGDIFLLTSQLIGEHVEHCEPTRISHIVWDSCAIAVCLISIIWFMVLYFYSNKRRHRKEKSETTVVNRLVDK